MAINKLWLVQKSSNGEPLWQNNPITGLKEPVYYDETEIHSFVDSNIGNDTTGNGTAALPWKTLSKVKSAGATYWATSKVIMCRGYFSESLYINVAITIIGAGGGIGGRAVITGSTYIGITGTSLINIHHLHSGTSLYQYNNLNTGNYAYNCIFVSSVFVNNRSAGDYRYFAAYFSYCILINVFYTIYAGNSYSLYRGNNTFYNCTCTASRTNVIYSNNNHCNTSTFFTGNSGSNNILNVNGQYLDVTNYNFNFLNTSPLFRKGTFDTDIDNYRHVGAGQEGKNYNASNNELNDDVSAVYTNLEKSGTEIYRPDVNLNGLLESGIIDLGGRRTKVILSTNYTLEQSSGVLQRFIQSTEDRSITQILDCIIKYGETEVDLATCPDLLVEYGKLITVSGTGDDRKGNADPNFDVSDMIPIDRLIIGFLKIIEFKFRSL